MIIKCIIIDDEELARTLLDNYIHRVPGMELIGSFKSPLEVVSILQDIKIDLMFLDIQMPELTGIEFLKALKSLKPLVVFTTAYPQHALEGFELDVVDYLVKPFSFERFLHCVQKVGSMIEKSSNSFQNQNAHLVINSGHKTYKVSIDDILYIEGLREYVSYYTSDNKRIISLESLKDIEEKLSKSNFVRVHKSYIVNATKIKIIEGNNIIIGNKEIPIGNTFKTEALKRILR